MPIRVYYEVLNQKGTPALYSDNYAQRPAAGYQGRIFNSPDTGQIFYDTGTTWTLLADAGVGSGSLASVCANGNTTATGISITAGGLSTNDFTNTGFAASVGYVWFAGTGGQMTGTQSFFWDNNNKWLGLGTNTPTAPFDIHTTGNIGIQINNTTTADSKIAFLNADVGKWRIGNLYSGGANLFHIYNNAGATLAMQINSSNAALFYGSLSANNFIQTNGGISLIHNAVPTSSGYTGIGGLTAGLSIALATGFNQTLTFPTGVAYTYTFPSATGTIALTSNLSSYLPLTGGTLTGALNGTSATFSSNVQIQSSNGIKLNRSANDYYWQINSDSSNYLNFGTYLANGTAYGTNPKMILLDNGNVGLGVNNPSSILELKTSTATNSLILGVTAQNSAFNIISLNGTRTEGQYVGFAGGGSTDTSLYYQSGNGGDHYFRTGNGTSFGTALLIKNAGWVLINTSTTNSYPLEIEASTGGEQIYLKRSGANGQIFMGGSTGAGTTLFVRANGSGGVQLTSGATSWASASDLRLKNINSNIENAIEKINTLRAVNFSWKYDIDNKNNLGLIAQDIEKVFPEIVSFDKEKDEYAVRYTELIPVLVKAVQELNNKIENLN